MALYDFVSPGSFSVDLRSGIKAQARSGRDTLPCTRKLRYIRASFSNRESGANLIASVL